MSKPLFSLERLLNPISADAPCGEDCRQLPESPYQLIKECRHQVRNLERQSSYNSDSRSEQAQRWQTIFDQSQRILSERSKDLEVAVWLLEASLRLHGFNGLKQSIIVITKLLDKFTDTLHPLADHTLPATEKIEIQTAALTNLNGAEGNGTLITPIWLTPVTKEKQYTLWDYQQATALENIKSADRKQKLIDSGVVTLQQFQQDLTHTPDAFLRKLNDDLEDCIIHYQELTNTLTEIYQDLAPPSSKIKNALLEFQQTLTTLRPNSAIKQEPEKPHDPLISTPTTSPNDHYDRHQLFSELLNIAAKIEQQEPHSPAPYLIKRAVEWGQLSLAELIPKIIQDQNSQHRVFELTGINQQQ